MSDKISFTPSKIQQLKPKKKRYCVSDSKVQHLVLLVYPKGTKTFCYYGRIDGKNPVYKTIGQFPTISVDVARQEAIKIQDTINQKKNPLKNSKLEKLYFSQCYEMFMEQKRATLSSLTIRDYQSYWRRCLEPRLAYKKLYEIDTDLLQTIHFEMKETPYQANRVITLVKSVFNHMIRKKGYVGTNPANGVEMYDEQPRNSFLYPDEIKELLQAMTNDDSTNFLFNVAILFLIVFGVRKTNVLEMKWSQIDLKNKLWTIPKTKNGDEKICTIPPVLIPFFEKLKKYKIDGNDYVLASPASATGHIVEIRQYFERLIKQIGVKRHIRLHDLRHTYGTMSALLNHSPSIIKAELGHRTMNASNRYINIANQMITNYRDETISKLLGQITAPALILDKDGSDDSIASQIAKNMNTTEPSIITGNVSQKEIAKMFKEAHAKKKKS